MSRMKWFERSLLHLILLLLAVSLVSFLLVSMSPVDPLQTNVGQTALGSMAPEQIEKLQAYWGVGEPVWKRFFSWISGICHGDFGISLLYRRPVLEVIAEKASASVWLLLSAWLFSGIVGIFLGIAAAAKRGKWVDRLITGYCIVIAGTPSFWLALVLLLLFTVQLPIFPIGFSVPVGMAADEVSLADRLYHAFLPACTLGLTGISSIAMHTREKVIEILESDYVLYARARGESGWRLIFRHGLRNLLLPVITLQFGSISEIFGGSVLVEQVFPIRDSDRRRSRRGWEAISRFCWELHSSVPCLYLQEMQRRMGCTGWSIRDLGKEAGHEKENTLAAGNFPPFPDSGDIAWNRLGGCRTAGRFCEKKPASGNWRGVWNRLDGAGYAETDGCGAFFKHPAGASDRGDQRRSGIGACIAGVAWRGTDGFIGMRAD